MTLLSEKQVAAWLGISQRMLQRMRADGADLPYVRIGVRRIGYRQADVAAFIARGVFKSRAAELASKAV